MAPVVRSSDCTLQDAGNGQFGVSGELIVSSVAALRDEGRRVFAALAGPVTVDLARVTRADSAGLALLIDWLAWARGAGRQLKFTHVPPTLAALARISDVEDLLGTAHAGAAQAGAEPASDAQAADA